jgi:putative transposase
MPFWRLYYHLVWATKNREPLIQPKIERRLFAYLVSKAAELGVYVYAVNGWYDHIHMVVSIPPRLSVSELVKKLKGASSHDLNQSGGYEGSFAWQRGYGVLSMGETQRSKIAAYVTGQKQHHEQQTADPWLEREAEEDEGPSETGLAPQPVSPGLREEESVYAAWGEPPV